MNNPVFTVGALNAGLDEDIIHIDLACMYFWLYSLDVIGLITYLLTYVLT